MADFVQSGEIGTLHNLRNRSVEELEADLASWSKVTPMSLVLPCLYSELEGPALGPIIDKLCHATYLEEIIIGLDRANREQFDIARKFFDRLPQKKVILWNDGPRLLSVDASLAAEALAPTELGKGRNVWYCFGYFLAAGYSKAVALHDCDIVMYRREMLARLLYPIVHPLFDYVFCKGYYYRSADGRLNGRVVRLLVAPLLRAMKQTLGADDYLDFMSSFRYPLAGEFSMRAEVVPSLRIPSDWGLEIGTLSEMYRNYSHHRICQVDIADAYDHKHQEVSEDDATRGLNRMSVDICKTLFRKLAVQGVVFSPEVLRTLKACYYRTALDMVDHYYNDAVMSGLTLDRHREEKTIELFAQSILNAGDVYFSNPHATPFVPSWSRVHSAHPGIEEMICDAVYADNA
ncbi:MAG: glycosyl transferase [Planctomycetales bacterium]|nr:glycosyl transferase [Planctomycetales bacterium]